MSGLSASQLLEAGMTEWPDAVPVSAVLIVAALDAETGDEHLYMRRDTDTAIWKHIGMLDVTLGDLRADCRDEG